LRQWGGVNLYELGDSLYVNLTNRCPVSCVFCIKKEWQYQFHGQDLRLGAAEPQVRDLLTEMDERLAAEGRYEEMVFCGFGEPTVRMDAVNAVGLRARLHHPRLPLRLDTIGLGSLLHGRNIVPELALFLDSVSVSLNTADRAQWAALHRPAPELAERAFPAVLGFVRDCVDAGIRTRVTAVRQAGVDLAAVRLLARDLGAAFLARPALAAAP
jgi:TatD family-associated radical SAM protein